MIGIGAQGTALEIARLTRWTGESKIAKTLAIVSLLGGLVLLVAPWRQNAVGQGRVIAFSPNERELEIQAPVKGRVVRWHHQEGDLVEPGEVIVELADNDPKVLKRYRSQRQAVIRRVQAAQASVEALSRKIEALEQERALTLSSAAAQIEVAETKARAAVLELEAAEAQKRTALLQLRRLEDLADEGLTSERDLEVARRNAAKARADMLKARAAVEGAQSEVNSKRAERRSKGSKLAGEISSAEDKLQSARSKRAQAEAALETVERELARQNSLDVKAPRAGMLVGVRAREGSAFVKQGQTLASIIPHADRRAVELFVSGLDGPLVVPGQEVRLQFEGWPAIQFGGWPEAAVGTFSGKVSFVDAQATPRGQFRVVVVPDDEANWPNAKVLRQGNLANGWILLQKVPLGYELWRQLNGFPPDLPPEAAKASGLKKTKARKPKN
jgi:multidrug efflux pump subunit AcrA (membrane-fusion protein)